MARPIVHQIFSNTVVQAAQAVPTAALECRPTEGEPGASVSLLVFVTGPVTGTTPSLTFNIEVSDDGVNWFGVASGAAITATNAKQRITANNITEPFIRVNPVLSGTATPTFNGTYAHLSIG